MENTTTVDQNTKEVFMSHVFTSAIYSFSLYENRIIYKILEASQKWKDEEQIKNLPYNVKIEIPYKHIIKEAGDNNHLKVKEAIKSLATKTIEYKTKREGVEIERICQIVLNPEIDIVNGNITFFVCKDLINVFFDFSRGYRKVDLIPLMKLKSIYSMRLFCLVSNNKTAVRHTIENIRTILKIKDKYPRNKDLIRFVFDKAKKELDKVSPHSFKIITETKNRTIKYITIVPIYIEENEISGLKEIRERNKLSVFSMLPAVDIKYLRENFLFTDTEIKNNAEIILEFIKNNDLREFTANNFRNIMNAKNPKGYLIGSIKKLIDKKN